MKRILRKATNCVVAAALMVGCAASVQIGAVPVQAVEMRDVVGISLQSSNIFNSCYGTIINGSISCTVSLRGSGKITVRTILQKKTGSSWSNYDSGDAGKTVSGVNKTTHTYSCSMPSGATYRCYYTVTATVDGVTSSTSGYSSSLTV